MVLRMSAGSRCFLSIITVLSIVYFTSPASVAHQISSTVYRSRPYTAAPSLQVHNPLNGTIVDSNNTVVTLHGVNIEGTEINCLHGDGTASKIFNEPLQDLEHLSDGNYIPTTTEVTTMHDTWHINVVRIPLNEDCWLGIHGNNNTWIGSTYRSTIQDYVTRLTSYGINVILSLQYTAPGTNRSITTEMMPDADHAGDFWDDSTYGVATLFGGNDAVIFDAFNEPFPGSDSWDWWKNGTVGSTHQCTDDGTYSCLGMQALVTDIRNTGANNIIMLGGVNGSKYFSGWVSYLPSDADNNLVPDGHTYNGADGWNQTQFFDLLQSDGYPLIAGEIGEQNLCSNGTDSHGQYIYNKMNDLDGLTYGAITTPGSYLIWGWLAGSPGNFNMITGWTSPGTPTNYYGAAAYDHFTGASFTDCT